MLGDAQWTLDGVCLVSEASMKEDTEECKQESLLPEHKADASLADASFIGGQLLDRKVHYNMTGQLHGSDLQIVLSVWVTIQSSYKAEP